MTMMNKKMVIPAMVSRLQWWNKLHGCGCRLLLCLMVPSVCCEVFCRLFYGRWNDRRELMPKKVSCKRFLLVWQWQRPSCSLLLTPVPTSCCNRHAGVGLCLVLLVRLERAKWFRVADRILVLTQTKQHHVGFQSPPWCCFGWVNTKTLSTVVNIGAGGWWRKCCCKFIQKSTMVLDVGLEANCRRW